ncbi:restriction endonuclease subunit S [Aeromonas dhakensis]
MVPKGWKKTHLKCVISGAIKNGYSPLPASTTTGYWVLSLGALTDHGINPLEIKPVVVDEKVKQALLSHGDFLISRSNTPDKVGRSIRFKNEVQNCSYPDLMMRFCVDATKADPDYIEIKLKSTGVRQYYKSCAAGSSSSMVKINKAVVENTPLLLPPFPEQKKIAKILSTWDKAISTTEQLLANSQQQKRALMQQLLTGKKRLLDNNRVRFSGEWKKSTLGNLGNTFNGLTGKTKDDFGFGKKYIPYINIFKNSRIDLEALDLVDVKEGESQSLTQFGDIFFTTSSETPDEVGMSSVLLDQVDEVYLNSFCFGFRLFDFKSLLPEFARHLLRSENIRSEIAVLGQGATRYNLSKKQLMKLELVLPNINEQKKIATILSTADQEIAALQQKLDALKQEKKALMQQLLTGKRRVKVEEAA